MKLQNKVFIRFVKRLSSEIYMQNSQQTDAGNRTEWTCTRNTQKKTKRIVSKELDACARALCLIDLHKPDAPTNIWYEYLPKKNGLRDANTELKPKSPRNAYRFYLLLCIIFFFFFLTHSLPPVWCRSSFASLWRRLWRVHDNIAQRRKRRIDGWNNNKYMYEWTSDLVAHANVVSRKCKLATGAASKYAQTHRHTHKT